jgi:hypothetical protein
MHTKTLLCFLFLLFVITAPAEAASGQPPVEEILKKVEAVYQNLQSYQFAAQYDARAVENRLDDGMNTSDSRSPNAIEYTMGRGVNSYIEFAAVNPSKARLWVNISQASNTSQILVVSDGHTTWASMPLQKQYTEKLTPLDGRSEAEVRDVREELQFIRQYWSLLVGRYRDVSKFSPLARLGKDARLKVGGEKADCYNIKWQTQEANDEIWVDKDRFIVWRLKQTPRAGTPSEHFARPM